MRKVVWGKQRMPWVFSDPLWALLFEEFAQLLLKILGLSILWCRHLKSLLNSSLQSLPNNMAFHNTLVQLTERTRTSSNEVTGLWITSTKNRLSLIIQAAGDYKYYFFDVVGKWPGRVHDARIFAHSELNTCLQNHTIQLCVRKLSIPNADNGCESIKVFLLGDPDRPLLPNVIILRKEFTGGGVTLQEQYFGLKLCKARMVIE